MALYHICEVFVNPFKNYYAFLLCSIINVECYSYWEIKMDCLKRIKELLDERNWTMYQLSHRADIPQSTLSNLFARNNAPSIPTLEKICQALGISLAEFFGSKNETNEEEKILKEWRLLSPKMKKAINELIKELNNK